MNMRFVKRIITLLLSMSFTFSTAQGLTVLRFKDHPENVKPGKYIDIKWESRNLPSERIDLEYQILPSSTSVNIVKKYPAYLGTYRWKIPKHLKGVNLKLVIKNSKNSLFSHFMYVFVSGKREISTQDILDHTKRLKEKYDIVIPDKGKAYNSSKDLHWSSSNISQKIQVKSFYEIAKKENKDLFMPKDEFETKAEYGIRLKQQNKYIEYLNNEMITELNAAREKKRKIIERKALEKKRMLQIKIQESLEQVVYSPSAISKYNPENSTFTLTVNYENHTVRIPRDDARTYKPAYKESKVEGFKQLRPNLKGYEHFNMVVIHPLTGKRFPYGSTKNIDSLKFSFQKNLDEKYYGSEIEVTVVKKDGSTVNGVLIKKGPDYVWIQTRDKTPVKIIVDEIEFMSSSTQILNNNGKSTPNQLSLNHASNENNGGIKSKVEYIPYDNPPVAMSPIRPVYPEVAQEAGIEGVVVVQAFIDEKGRVKETLILKGIPNTGLNEAAMYAIRKTRFRPATQVGQSVPVAVWVSIPVNFKLK